MKIVVAATLPLFATACAPYADLPSASPFTAAAAASAAGLAAPGPGVVYTSRPIADPDDWRSLNDAQVEGGR